MCLGLEFWAALACLLGKMGGLGRVFASSGISAGGGPWSLEPEASDSNPPLLNFLSSPCCMKGSEAGEPPEQAAPPALLPQVLLCWGLWNGPARGWASSDLCACPAQYRWAPHLLLDSAGFCTFWSISPSPCCVASVGYILSSLTRTDLTSPLLGRSKTASS